jgi:glutamine synthetase
VAGSAALAGAGANAEIKVFDAAANAYLVVGAVIAAGLDGLARSASLPAQVTVDPATLDDAARSAAGIRRLPTSLSEALAAFMATPVLATAMGPALADTWRSVRQAEVDRFAASSADEVARASRWVW